MTPSCAPTPSTCRAPQRGLSCDPWSAPSSTSASTPKEQTENLSLPTQLRACEEYCQREGFEVVQRFKEQGESAKTADPDRGPIVRRVFKEYASGRFTKQQMLQQATRWGLTNREDNLSARR